MKWSEVAELIHKEQDVHVDANRLRIDRVSRSSDGRKAGFWFTDCQYLPFSVIDSCYRMIPIKKSSSETAVSCTTVGFLDWDVHVFLNKETQQVHEIHNVKTSASVLPHEDTVLTKTILSSPLDCYYCSKQKRRHNNKNSLRKLTKFLQRTTVIVTVSGGLMLAMVSSLAIVNTNRLQ